MYDSNWKVVTDYTDLEVGQKVYLTTTGSTDHPQGVTKARFRINGGAWQETTKQKDDKFYIEYPIPTAGSYEVEAMVYNPELGWF